MKKIVTFLILMSSIFFSISVKASERVSFINFYQIIHTNDIGWNIYDGRSLVADKVEDGYLSTEATNIRFEWMATDISSPLFSIYDSQGQIIADSTRNKGLVSNLPVANRLINNEKYTLKDSRGRIIAYFIAKAPTGEINQPIISAQDRIVVKDTNSFNIMDGVQAKDYKGKDITDKIVVSGTVNIHEIGDYKVTFSVFDDYGGYAEKEVTISVVESTNELPPPIIDTVTDKDTVVTGTATPKTIIYFTIGDAQYREHVGDNGYFRILLDETYESGTKFVAHVEDEEGNRSVDYNGVVESSTTFGVNKIDTSDTYVTGRAAPYSKIEIAIYNTKERIFEGETDSSGFYNVSLQGHTYSAGTKVAVTAIVDGERSEPIIVIVYPKSPTINTVKTGDTAITGNIDANAKIELWVNQTKYEGFADNFGDFSVETPRLLSGTSILAKQISNQIESDQIQIYVQEAIIE